MINACETEDGVVFDMSGLECDALRSYADGVLTDPAHPFVELLRGQGLVVGDTPVPHLAEVIDTEVDEATASFWVDVADEAWVGLAVRVDDAASYPDLSGDSWRVIAISEDVCEVLSVVEFAELYPDDVPLLTGEDGEFWAAVAPSSPEVLWEDIEDVLVE